MYHKELEYIKNNQTKEWIFEIRDQIEKLNQNLSIAIFVNGVNELDKILEKNSLIKEKKMELHIEGIYEDDIQEIVPRTRLKMKLYEDNEELITISKEDLNDTVISEIRKVVRNLPELIKEGDYIVKLDKPMSQIKEELSQIFLDEENRIKYNHLMVNSEILEYEKDNEIKVKKNKI